MKRLRKPGFLTAFIFIIGAFVPLAVTFGAENSASTIVSAYAEKLQSAKDGSAAGAMLLALRSELAGKPKNEQISAIRAFLGTKADASTHLSFSVERDGALGQHPTLRVFLLDLFGQLDVRTAAVDAKTMLEE